MPKKAVIDYNTYLDVTEAILFKDWKTIEEIMKDSSVNKREVKKVIKKLIDKDLLEVKGTKYRYGNGLT